MSYLLSLDFMDGKDNALIERGLSSQEERNIVQNLRKVKAGEGPMAKRIDQYTAFDVD